MMFPNSKDENLTILLISKSNLLKNYFIQSISNNINNFMLMNKTIESNTGHHNFTCFICDYSLDDGQSRNYIQLIDINGKNKIFFKL